MSFLKGYKTYLVAAGLGLVAAAQYLGYIDTEMAALLGTALAGGGFAALRAGVKG
jgi:hypothetical protein